MKINNKVKSDQSFVSAIENMARFLRKEAKKTQIVKKAAPHAGESSGFTASIEKIALLLRQQVHGLPPDKKRDWKQLQ